MKTLALNILIKNESENLQKYGLLNNLQHFDEIIVIDSNSTDNSIEILKKYTNKIFHYPINKEFDFSYARNLAIENTKSDYILWLDADMYISKKDILHIKKTINQTQNLSAFYITVTNIFEKKRESIKKIMLFPNLPKKIYWQNRIHENIESSINQNNINIENLHINIDHFGYYNLNISKNKITRNINLLENSLKDRNNLSDRFMLALSQFEIKDYNNSIKNLNQSLKAHDIQNQHIYPYIHYYLGLNYYALKEIKESINQLNKAIEIKRYGQFFATLGEIKFKNNINPTTDLTDAILADYDQFIPSDINHLKRKSLNYLISWSLKNGDNSYIKKIDEIKDKILTIIDNFNISLIIANTLYTNNHKSDSIDFFNKSEELLNSYWNSKKLPKNTVLKLKFIQKRVSNEPNDFIAYNKLIKILIDNNQKDKIENYQNLIKQINPIYKIQI